MAVAVCVWMSALSAKGHQQQREPLGDPSGPPFQRNHTLTYDILARFVFVWKHAAYLEACCQAPDAFRFSGICAISSYFFV